ncbi:MAG: FAD-dependent oxidoreductase [Opitutaceae bacterium]|nr:FAD-dependent oxidoreductase [Opitutaceae bacterium]
MAKVVILGAGIAGHTAATLLRRKLPKAHEIVVISPEPEWNWVPSNIWVGVGAMPRTSVVFALAPLYARLGIAFRQGRAVALHPEGDAASSTPFVEYTPAGAAADAPPQRETYDFLVNATGPKLNFAATPGLGPHGGHTVSVCTADHAVEAAHGFLASVERMRKGERQTLVVGMGHGTCTCQGAAFEYVFNVEHELRRLGVRDKARVVYLSNEYEVGDFGMGGLHLRRGGYVIPSRMFAESLFAERGIDWITRSHVRGVAPGKIDYTTLDDAEQELGFDFAMLIPPFRGIGLAAFDRSGAETTTKLFAPSGFMRVDADYTEKPFEQWSPADWPRTYRSPVYENIFAAGIAFAPPHAVSRPLRSPKGTLVAPAVPRTGMTAGIMGRTVAFSIADRVLRGPDAPLHEAPFATMGAACVASAGSGLLRGSAATITMYPVVPDYSRYEFGRDLDYTSGEVGLAGHWLKFVLHHLFLHKARCRPLWWMIPE